MRGSCIYIIKNFIDNRTYVGSTGNFINRYGNHKRQLKDGVHSNPHLQNFVNKYGFGAIYFDLLEQCEPEKLIEREQHFIDTLKPEFNMSQYAVALLGHSKRPKTEEHKRKLSEALKGRKLSPEMRAKISEGQKGRVVSEETKKKLAAWNTGRKMPADAVEKMRLTKIGKPVRPEVMEQRRLNPRQITPETRKKLSEAATKQWQRFRTQ